MVTACKMDLEMEEFGAQLSQRRGIDHLIFSSGFNHKTKKPSDCT
jgi:hypothetical protein